MLKRGRYWGRSCNFPLHGIFMRRRFVVYKLTGITARQLPNVPSVTNNENEIRNLQIHLCIEGSNLKSSRLSWLWQHAFALDLVGLVCSLQTNKLVAANLIEGALRKTFHELSVVCRTMWGWTIRRIHHKWWNSPQTRIEQNLVDRSNQRIDIWRGKPDGTQLEKPSDVKVDPTSL